MKIETKVALSRPVRPKLSEQVSDALVETDNEGVITALLSNKSALISNTTMGHLVEQSGRVIGYQKPLVHRHDLPNELAKKLYWAVSAALRTHIVANFDLDPAYIDEDMEAAVQDAMGNNTYPVRERSAGSNPITRPLCSTRSPLPYAPS